MAIIIQREGDRAQLVQPTGFRLEAELQRYIRENPEVLLIDEIKEDTPFAVLDWETPVAAGSIDILGVDGDGKIYIIETKLFRNPDKRKLLAQVLDYVAAIWSSYQDPEDFLHTLEGRLSGRGTTLDEFLTQHFDDPERVTSGIKGCVQDGTFRFVVLMDRLPTGLRDLILFLNRHSNFSVYAVELEHYVHGDLHIFVPHVFGAEERKRVPSSSGREWNEVSFFQDLEEKTDARTVAAVRKLYQFSKERADDISWGRGGVTGSFNPKFFFIARQSLYTVWSNGRITVNFGWLTSGGAEEYRERLRAELKRIPALAKYIPDEGLKSPGIPASAWVPISEELISTLDRFLAYAKEGSSQAQNQSPVMREEAT